MDDIPRSAAVVEPAAGSEHKDETLMDNNPENKSPSDPAVTTEAPRFLHVQRAAANGAQVATGLVPSTAAAESLTTTNGGIDEEKVMEPDDDLAARANHKSRWSTRHLQHKLYGREREEAILRDCFDSLQQQATDSNKTSRFLLVSGPSGTGKTRLVKSTLAGPAQSCGGYFISGKFDQPCRREPYAALVAAFNEFTNMVLDRGEEARMAMREAILQAVGTDEVSVLTSMIPSLEEILACRASCPKQTSSKKGSSALQRFVFVFRMFMRSVCSAEQPLVLLLDDLQYADPCSLDLLANLVTDKDNHGLFVVGTCDDGDIQPDSYLAVKLRDMEDREHVKIINVPLANLPQSVVSQLVGETFDLESEQRERLGSFVFQQTKGNMFYVGEYLRWLEDSDLLFFSSDSQTWKWDDDEVRLTITTSAVCEFLVDRLEHLRSQVKDVLKVAACLGSYLDEDLIESVLKIPVGELLKEAASVGIVTYDEGRGSYLFEHDGVQHAAYKLIPSGELEQFHLHVGRRLWRSLDGEDDIDRHIFALLSQMKIGQRLIAKDKEKSAIATLCLQAGQKAARASTFRTAAIYLNFGIELLGSRGFVDEYYLTLALYNAAAEMELCTANLEHMNELLEQVFQHSRSSRDKVQAYSTKIYALGVADQQEEAIDTGVMVLRALGEKFPKNLSKFNLMLEMMSVKRLLRGKSDEQLLRLPAMDNEEKWSALGILGLIFSNALFTRPTFAAFVTLRMMKITLQHGLSAIASCAFSTYGMILIGSGMDIESGYRYGRLGLVLLDRYEALEYLPRVYAAYYGIIHVWKNPVRSTKEPLLRAYRTGLQTGDIEFAVLCANIYCFNSIDSGTPLDIVDREWVGIREVMKTYRQTAYLRMTLAAVQVLHHYMGLTEDPLSPKGDVADMDDLLQFAVDNGKTSNIYGIRGCRCMLAYVFNDYEGASAFCMTEKEFTSLPPTCETILNRLIAGLLVLELARQGKDYRRNMRVARRHLKIMKRFSTWSPHNFSDKRFLLEAEIASVQGQADRAYEMYTCAIALAGDSGFLFMQALGNERAARHLYALGEVADAEPFFRKAGEAYAAWGAKRKVEWLEREMRTVLYKDWSSEKERNRFSNATREGSHEHTI